MLYHELALLGNFAVLWWMQAGQVSHVAICTFAMLWCMRLSAKLNLFFGVPQNGAQYLPDHLKYLASYFRTTRGMSLWFVLSMGVAMGTWFWLALARPARRGGHHHRLGHAGHAAGTRDC